VAPVRPNVRRGDQNGAFLGNYSFWWWHLDEVLVKINGERHYLWRAVDHEGEVAFRAIADKPSLTINFFKLL
jgi:transposase-like protein